MLRVKPKIFLFCEDILKAISKRPAKIRLAHAIEPMLCNLADIKSEKINPTNTIGHGGNN